MAYNSNCVGIPFDFSNDTKTAYLWSYSPQETAVVSIILPIFTIFGVVGNCAFIFAVLRVPSLRSLSVNYYLVALAITDLIILVAGLAFFIWPYSSSEVSYHAPFTCGGIYGVILPGIMISALLITVVSIDRYVAIVRPLRYHTIKKRHNLQIIFAVCIIGIVVGAICMPVLGKNIAVCITWPDVERYQNYPTSIEFCGPYYPANFNGSILLVTIQDIPIFLSMFLNFILYWKIIKKLASGTAIQGSENTNAMRDQVARMLVINGSVFFLCHVPPRVYNLGELISAEVKGMWLTPEQNETMLLIVRLTFLLNSAINPYIYGVASSHYRQAIREAFRPRASSARKDSSNDLSPATKSFGLSQSNTNPSSI